jgi:hypothetical protein
MYTLHTLSKKVSLYIYRLPGKKVYPKNKLTHTHTAHTLSKSTSEILSNPQRIHTKTGHQSTASLDIQPAASCGTAVSSPGSRNEGPVASGRQSVAG